MERGSFFTASRNRELKNPYTDLLDDLRIRFKDQITGAGITKN